MKSILEADFFYQEDGEWKKISGWLLNQASFSVSPVEHVVVTFVRVKTDKPEKYAIIIESFANVFVGEKFTPRRGFKCSFFNSYGEAEKEYRGLLKLKLD